MLRTFCLKKKTSGGQHFQNIFLINFLAKSGNSKHFSVFFIFFKKIINCGHYFCVPSTKIVVTMFACHLHSLDQSCVCRVTFKHFPQPLRSHIRSFGNLGQLLKFYKKNFKKHLKTPPGGQGGSPKLLGG